MEVSVYKNFRTRGKRPMRNLSLTDKVRAIQRIHDGETKASVSRDLGVPESTLRGWCKNENKLRFMSTQSQLLEGLADNLPEKRIVTKDSLEISTNYLNTNFIKEENNNYKIPEFHNNKNNVDSYMDFNPIDTSLLKFNWNLPFDQSNNCSSANLSHENSAFTIKTENMTADNNLETFIQNQKIMSSDAEFPQASSFHDILSNYKSGDTTTFMQWCQIFVTNVNFMAQAAMAAENKFDTSTSSSTEPESTSVISSICTGKRTYDDPYSELRNIYELQKGPESDDSFDDDFVADDEDKPQDLSIRS